MTCPGCGREEEQERKRALYRKPDGKHLKMTIHHQCPNGHAWHTPLVIALGMAPETCDCEESG